MEKVVDCLFELMHPRPIRRSRWTFVGIKSPNSIAQFYCSLDRLGKKKADAEKGGFNFYDKKPDL
jgi:hypothetical protein